MAKKFIMACPSCGIYVEGKTGFFAKKKIQCNCGYKIDLALEHMVSKVCEHCGNVVIYDVRKGEEATCLVCGEQLNKREDLFNLYELSCPDCACKMTVRKNALTESCPMCGKVVDVQAAIKADEAKKEGHASLIKCEGDRGTFVWKHPLEDFNCGSQLIVNESQAALFFRDGKAYDVLGAGRYTLSTADMPLLDEVYKMNDDVVVHTQVYFVNMATQMNIKWGTDSKVRLLDPESNLYVEIGACGSFNLRVCDPKKLMYKLVGVNAAFGVDEVMGFECFGIEFIVGKFKSLVMNKVKSNLARIITSSKISVITVDQYMDLMSDRMKDVINEVLEEYGLTMPQFYITNIMLPDDDPNFRRLKQQYAEKTLRVREEEIKKAEAQARQDRLVVEHETNAKIELIDSQGYVDSLKLKNAAEAEAYAIRVKAEAEGVKLMTEAAADGVKAMGFADAEVLKAKGGDYKLETDRIVNSTIAENGVTFVNVKVDNADKWTCSACGKTGITSNFCPDCGAKKLSAPTTWDCACGTKGIKSNFCPDCGAKRP